MKAWMGALMVSAALLGGGALAADEDEERAANRERCEELAKLAEKAKYSGNQLSSSQLAEWDRLCAPTVYRGEAHGNYPNSQVESGGEVWNTGSGTGHLPDIPDESATGGSGEGDEGEAATEQAE